MELLQKGRAKGRNIFLIGRANCGKSFLIRPLEKIYRALVNPAQNSFSFAGIEGKEVVVLDDFRFTNGKPIAWSDFLLLLDRATVNFSLPKSFHSSDYCLPDTNTIPVFCTGKALPVFCEGGQVDLIGSEMLRTRFRVFVLYKQIPSYEARECPPCCRCFCELLNTHAPQLKKESP